MAIAPNRKLNDASAKAIRDKYAAGRTIGSLRREYHLNWNTVAKIVRGETYTDEVKIWKR